MSPAQTARVRKLAAREKLNVLVPVAEGAPSSAGTVAAANAACRALKLAAAGSRCAVYARTLASARAIAELGAADVVLVRAGLGSLKGLRTAPGRVVATAALPAPAGFHKSSRGSAGRWSRARGRTVDLSVALRSRKAALGAYLGVVRPIATTGDRRFPAKPRRARHHEPDRLDDHARLGRVQATTAAWRATASTSTGSGSARPSAGRRRSQDFRAAART